MRTMTEKVRAEIQSYKKNRLDISELIKDYYIKNENLSGCVIKNISRINEDISNCNFSGCVIGERGNITHFSGSDLRGCNFKNARFEGKVWLRKADVRYCNWSDCYCPFVEYQHSNFEHCNFCNTIWVLGSRAGHGAKFSKEVFEKWGLILT